LFDTGLLLDQGKGCLLIPLLPEDLHHLGENFVDVEFTRPCHWAPPFILRPGSYQFFTTRSRIKIPAPRPYPRCSRLRSNTAQVLPITANRPRAETRKLWKFQVVEQLHAALGSAATARRVGTRHNAA